MPIIYNDILKDKKWIHFIGIGGSGMYPLAQICHSLGYKITGSDNNETDTLKAVRALGIQVYMGQRAENIGPADLIVYTAAIMKDNPELIAAKESPALCVERSVLLGSLSRKFQNAVCVCGTHGKTTSTAMLTQVLIEAGQDPTAVIGGRLPLIGGNGRVGKSDLFVCEACEYVDTFLKLDPQVSVVLNIDNDHLEYFGTVDNIIRSFNKFNKMASDCVIINGDDANAMKSLDGVTNPIITFGISENCDYKAVNITTHREVFYEYDLQHEDKILCHIRLQVPGYHNIYNSLAVSVAALHCGVTPEQLASSIVNFKGAGRRFEYLGQVNGADIYDDYAHHPKELEVTLNTAVKMGYERVIAIFQPFTFSRTKMLMDDFVRVLSIPSVCIVTDIMGSREINTWGVKAEDLSSQIPNAVQVHSFEQAAEWVKNNCKKGDLILTLGCGDVYKIDKLLLNHN